MKQFAKWTYLFLGVVLLFIGLNYSLWKLYTEDLLTSNNGYVSGGLDRLGYLPHSKHYRRHGEPGSLTKRHIRASEYQGQPIDIITIGDSFSQGAGGGKDNYYQDWIASLQGLSVLNIPRYKNGDGITTVMALLKSGLLDRINPKHVLIESSERLAVVLYFNPTFNVKDSPEEIAAWFAFGREREKKTSKKASTGLVAEAHAEDTGAMAGLDEESGKLPDVFFINTGNFKLIFNAAAYRFSDNAFNNSPVYVKKLDRPFFSVKDADRLLFYYEDVKNISLFKNQEAYVDLVNDNLNMLADVLKKKGIQLWFMPIVDKYDLYSPYIINNKFPRSSYFEKMRALPKRYAMIDTKAILSGELTKGEKDLFWADDTHWTWKSSKKVFETVKF